LYYQSALVLEIPNERKAKFETPYDRADRLGLICHSCDCLKTECQCWSEAEEADLQNDAQKDLD
jgi:hypothetical protein